MEIICKLLRQNPNTREGIIAGTSGLGIIVNLAIAIIKIIAGALASSIAIISEGINNASDALTGMLTLVGSKLARMHPDKKHPFGYGRIEYLTSLIISILILITGFEVLTSSFRLIITPEEPSISVLSLIIVAFSAAIKFFMGNYTIKMGKKANSGALEAIGIEGRNDSFMSIVTIASALVFIIFKFSIDAYAGLFTSILVIKAGVEVLLSTVSELLGRPGEGALAARLYKQIRSTEGIVNAADLTLHNYGPEAWSGSVNVEIDHAVTIGDAYQLLHALQLKIMHEEHVTLVFGIYAVDNDHENVRQIRNTVAEFVRHHEHIKSYHAIYLEPGTNKIYCDLTVDYELKDWDKLRTEFTEYMKQHYPENDLEMTVETDFV